MNSYSVVLLPDRKTAIKLMGMMCGSEVIEKGMRPCVEMLTFQCEDDTAALAAYRDAQELAGITALEFFAAAMERYDAENKLYRVGLQLRHDLPLIKIRELFRMRIDKLALVEDEAFGSYIPQAVLGQGFTQEDAREAYLMLTDVFSPFSAVAEKTALIRLADMEIIEESELEHRCLGFDLPDERFTSLAPGMTADEAEKVLMRKLLLKKRRENGEEVLLARFIDNGVTLLFDPEDRTLHTIGLEAPFGLPVLGLDRNEVRRELGEPDRYLGNSGFYSNGWFYEHILGHATLELEFAAPPSGTCERVLMTRS